MKSECLNLCDFIGCEGGFAQGGGSLIHYSAKGHWTPTLSIIKQICGERGTTGSSTPKQPHSGTGGTCLSGSPHLRCPEPNGPQAHPPAHTCRRAALHARSACVCVWRLAAFLWVWVHGIGASVCECECECECVYVCVHMHTRARV